MTKIKTEHAGAKNGGGFWGKREEAKRISRSARRRDDKLSVSDLDETCIDQIAYDEWSRCEPVDES